MEKQKTEVKVFSTKDMNLAAAFITLGFPLIGITYQTEGTKPFPIGYFEYEETLELMETERNFWQGMLLVEPRKFTYNIRTLKSATVNAYNNPYSSIADKVNITGDNTVK